MGYLIDILDKIAKLENFSYILQDCTGGIHGSHSKTGWSGCISDLVQHVCNMYIPHT